MSSEEDEVIKLIKQFNETGEIDLNDFRKAVIKGETEEGNIYYVDFGRLVDLGKIVNQESRSSGGSSVIEYVITTIKKVGFARTRRAQTPDGTTYYTTGGNPPDDASNVI